MSVQLLNEIAELKQKILSLEGRNKKLRKLLDVSERGQLHATINTGSDTIYVYMERGNLADLQRVESFAQSMSMVGTLPELF